MVNMCPFVRRNVGLGHGAVRQEMVRDEPFAVMVGDDFMISDDTGLTRKHPMASDTTHAVIRSWEVPADKLSRYGIVMGEEITPGVYNITDGGETSHRHGGFPPRHCGTL